MPRGEAVQDDPIKPMLKAPGTKHLKPKCAEPPSNFAFKFNLRRYSVVSGYNAAGSSQGMNIWFEKLAGAAAVESGMSMVQVMAFDYEGDGIEMHLTGELELGCTPMGSRLLGRESFRTSSRQSLCSDQPSPRVGLRLHPEGKSCGHVRSRFQCLF